MTTHHHAASTYVLRLLGRQRTKAQRLPGSALSEALATLREEGRSALIEVELPNGSLGRLLVQVGRLVFVQYENKVAAEALAEVQEGAAEAHLYLLNLSDEQIIFACAALMGIPLALGETLPVAAEPFSVLLTQLGQQNFTGVVALEQGLQTLIWRFQRGRVLNPVEVPGRLRAGRLTQLVWEEQLLPEVGAAKADADTTQASGKAPTSAQTPGATQPKPVQATTPPPTPPAPTRAKAFQNPAVQAKVATSQLASQIATPQTAPHSAVQTTPQPAAQAASQLRSSSAPGQPQLREPRRPVRLEPGTEVVWAHFQEVLSAQLGSRGERVFQLIQSELGRFSGAELVGKLGLQVERIAGSTAAKSFRDRF